jgi:hypothetical protein
VTYLPIIVPTIDLSLPRNLAKFIIVIFSGLCPKVNVLLRPCGSKFKIYCNGNTFFLRINNINVIVYGMKQHCDIKIKFGRLKIN